MVTWVRAGKGGRESLSMPSGRPGVQSGLPQEVGGTLTWALEEGLRKGPFTAERWR